MNTTAAAIIRHLKLKPLEPEGGHFRRSFTHPRIYQSSSTSPARPLATVIYYLLTPADHSALHRLGSTEVWFYHLGDPLEMLLLHPDGSSDVSLLGSDLLSGHRVQQTIPPDTWQGCRPVYPKVGFTLCSALVSPGFDWDDFEIGHAQELIAQWPQQQEKIDALTPTI